MERKRGVRRGGDYLFADVSAGEPFTPEDFDDEQKQLADTTEQFVANEVLPKVRELENHDLPLMRKLLRRAGELGLLMIDAPEEYGGLELGKATGILAAEKISTYGGFYVSYMAHAGIGTLPLIYYGTDTQKRRYLTRIMTGEWIAAYCLTEPNSGSDALGARSTAVLSADGTHYVLNGTKQFITNGGFADLLTVFAKVDGARFTAFLVERSSPGITIGPEERKMGIRGSSTTQVIFEDVAVPAENVLGEVGKGHKIAFNVLNDGRFKLGAAVTGAAKHALVDAVKYANQRRQFGVPVSAFGAVREKVADMAARVVASESLVYRLAGMIDDRIAEISDGGAGRGEARRQGVEEFAAECAVAKVFCSEMLARVADAAVQVHGGYGFLQEYAVERCYRDERVNRIFEGTNEINRILIAKSLLRRAAAEESSAERERLGESLTGDDSPGGGSRGPFAAERALLSNLKRVFRAAAQTAASRFGDRASDEQELLGEIADIAISVFSLESLILRAARADGKVSQIVRRAFASAVTLFAFESAESVLRAARKAVLYCREGAVDTELLDWIGHAARYDAPDLLLAKRELAGAVISSEKYLFAR